jgi:hypothetical protein
MSGPRPPEKKRGREPLRINNVPEQGVEVDGAAIPALRVTTSNQAAPHLNFFVRRCTQHEAEGVPLRTRSTERLSCDIEVHYAFRIHSIGFWS